MSTSLMPSPGDTQDFRRFRRIITGHGADARSVILSDAQSPHFTPFMGVPGFVVTDLWRSGPAPVDNGPATADDPCRVPIDIPPPPGGSVFRTTEFPPETTWMPDRAASRPGQSHPHMHRTATLDYAIVLEGEIWAIMEDGEARLGPGDVVIQRGTRHAWANRSDAPSVVAFIMIDAAPLDE